MNNFSEKAFLKIAKLSHEDLKRFVENQINEANLRNSVLDSITDGFIAVSFQKKILYTNKIISDLIRVNTERKTSGTKLDAFVKEPEILAFMNKVIDKKKKNAEEEFNINNKLNGQRLIRVSCLNSKDFDGFIFCFQDVTFFKRIKEEFKKNESLAAMTTMAAGVAHEIKNPLASISIYLQMLEIKLLKQGSISVEDARKPLEVIKDEVDRINRIAVDFNFAVKPVNAVMTPININDVVNKTANLVRPEMEERHISFKLRLSNSLPKIKADANLVEQALLNLLKNSIQAIDKKDGTLEINTYIDEDMVRLDVSDNGCGMSDVQKSRIFEPYFTTKETGTGLGLTLLYKIMKEHEGDVFVSSQEGEGSTFSLLFPIPQSERFRIED